MLDRTKVMAALEQKRDEFLSYQAAQSRELDKIETKLEAFCTLSYAEIQTRLQYLGEAWPGAIPTPELDTADKFRLAFPNQWQSHAEARTWALAVVAGRPTAAVDGSQFLPTKEYGLPVAAVQIGWFINPHRVGVPYEKNLSFEIVAPSELALAEQGDADTANWLINQRRFEAECRKLIELMHQFAELPDEDRPLCYFDGSFVVSFAGTLRPERAQSYLHAVAELLAVSARLRVPVVAFVDSSASKDLVTLVNVVTGPEYMAITDGQLLEECLTNWGDRTPMFECARRDLLSTSERAGFYRDVYFSYVRLGTDRPPARIEVPRWLYEEGRAGWVIDMVCAECIAGARGYPYAAETADAVAVLQQADRERFYAILQQFAEREGLNFAPSRKSRSKQIRRA